MLDDSSKPAAAMPPNDAQSSITGRILFAVLWPTFSMFLASLLIGGLYALAIQFFPSAQDALSDLPVQFAVTALITVVAFLLAVYPFYGYFFPGRPPKRDVLGLRRSPTWQMLTLTFIAFGAYFLSSAIIMSVAQNVLTFVDFNQEQDLGFDVAVNGFELAIVFVMLVVVAPIAEELIFRGFMFKALRERIPFLPTALLVSLAFAVAHGQWNVGIDVFVLSMFLCGLREYTGSLWASILLHAAKNFLAFTLLFLFPDIINQMM